MNVAARLSIDSGRLASRIPTPKPSTTGSTVTNPASGLPVHATRAIVITCASATCYKSIPPTMRTIVCATTRKAAGA
jgi:hypothetical protein